MFFFHHDDADDVMMMMIQKQLYNKIIEILWLSKFEGIHLHYSTLYIKR